MSYCSRDGRPAILSPVSVYAEWFRTAALRKANRLARDQLDREHVTRYLYSHPEKFNVRLMPAPDEIDREDVRLTVDIDEDWDHALAIYEALGPERLDWQRIARLLDHQPALRSRMAALNRCISARVHVERQAVATAYAVRHARRGAMAASQHVGYAQHVTAGHALLCQQPECSRPDASPHSSIAAVRSRRAFAVRWAARRPTGRAIRRPDLPARSPRPPRPDADRSPPVDRFRLLARNRRNSRRSTPPAWAVPKNTSGCATPSASISVRNRAANTRFTRASGHFAMKRPQSTVDCEAARSHATRTTLMPNRSISSGTISAAAGNHLDILMSVEVRRLQAVVADDLHLPLPFVRMAARNLPPRPPQPGKQGENAGKTAVRVEQFGRIAAARKRPALGQIQMDAQIERPVGIAQPLAGRRRGQSVRAACSASKSFHCCSARSASGALANSEVLVSRPSRKPRRIPRSRPGSSPGRRRAVRGGRADGHA